MSTSEEWNKLEGLHILQRIHYQFFMANPRFWYDDDLIEADALVCWRMSQLREETQ